MKLEAEEAMRAPRGSRGVIGCAAAFLLCGAACSAVNRVGLDDGGTSGTNPGGATFVEAYGLSGDSTSGQLAVATGSVRGPVTMLDAHDGARVRFLSPTSQDAPNVMVCQANGFVAYADVNKVWVFKSDGTLLRVIPHSAAAVSAVTLSVDGTILVTADSNWTVHLFDVATGAEQMPPFVVLRPDEIGGAWIGSLGITPDRAHIAAGGAMGVRVWRASDRALLAKLPELTFNIALSAAGELAVSGQQDVAFYSLTGDLVGRYPVTGGSGPLAYSLDGTKLAIGTSVLDVPPSNLKLVKIVDRTTGTESATLFDDVQNGFLPNGNPNYLTGLAFVENDTAVAVGWSDRRVSLFGASDGLVIWRRTVDVY